MTTSKRQMEREFKTLVEKFNRVGMLAKIVSGALYYENPDNILFNLDAGIMNKNQVDQTKEFISSGEYARILDLVELNIAEKNAKKVKPKGNPSDGSVLDDSDGNDQKGECENNG